MKKQRRRLDEDRWDWRDEQEVIELEKRVKKMEHEWDEGDEKEVVNEEITRLREKIKELEERIPKEKRKARIQTTSIPVGKPFFCQMDGDKHPATDSGYQCVSCGRLVCEYCYLEMIHANITICPFCQQNLEKIQ